MGPEPAAGRAEHFARCKREVTASRALNLPRGKKGERWVLGKMKLTLKIQTNC